MSIQSELHMKAKNASGAAAGSSMGKSVPKVGMAPSKSNEQQPVTRNQAFSLKSVSWKSKSPSGY